MKRLKKSLARLCSDSKAISAVEFALILPVMLALFFGGYVYCETVSINRKVTLTTRALVDLTSQYAVMSTSDMNTVLGASTQIIAPYDPAPLSIKVSEVKVDLLGNVTVQWSASLNATAYAQGTAYTMPPGTATPGFYYIVSEVSYNYTPPALYNLTNSFNLSDRIIMIPRLSTYVTYNGS